MEKPALKKVVLSIHDLNVRFNTADTQVHAVKGIDVQLHQGECLGIVGESGSGKSQTFLAVMGLLARNGYASGSASFQDKNLLTLDVSALNRVRGNRISMIFQDPLTSLTPHLRIGEQMAEVLSVHQGLDRRQIRKVCLEWLQRVRIPEAENRLRQYPHELSGGMRQRVMIAMAMLCQPDILFADEPTTALDVTLQAEILDLMNELRQQHGTAIVMVTHDMGVVARMCDRVQVMRNGTFVETGDTDDIFYRPQHQYTRMLLDAVPAIPTNNENDSLSGIVPKASDTGLVSAKVDVAEHDIAGLPTSALVLDVDSVHVSFPIAGNWFSPVKKLVAVNNVSFQLYEGETLGVVGESGSGKSTLARAILQLLPNISGSVSWLGQNLRDVDKTAMRDLRRDLQIVFQDPMASLNPSLTIGECIMEPLRVHEPSLSLAQRAGKVASMMYRVGLDPNLINRYAHELSGGQNQRVGIARAMILQPGLLICDEAVSALDVSIQAQILKLIKSLQSEFGLTLVFISHDLSVVHEIAHRILVMYLGSVVELAPTKNLFLRPQHPYTRQLISSVPIANPVIERQRRRVRLVGELTSPLDPTAQLRFLPSRLKAGDHSYCPKLMEVFPGHYVAEHDELESLLLDKSLASN